MMIVVRELQRISIHGFIVHFSVETRRMREHVDSTGPTIFELSNLLLRSMRGNPLHPTVY